MSRLLIAAPFLLHWYVMGAVPEAATTNEADFPASIVWLAGCVMIAGATTGLVTVSTAALLVALPALLLTTAVNFALLSEVVSAGVVYAEEVAPLMATPFFSIDTSWARCRCHDVKCCRLSRDDIRARRLRRDCGRDRSRRGD